MEGSPHVAGIISQIRELAPPLWLTIAWILTVIIGGALFQAYTDPTSKIPGPTLSRWTGIVEMYYYVRGYRHAYVHSLHEKYGTSSSTGYK